MKVHSAGGWIAGVLALLFILWQLVEAVFFGRMADILFDDDDTLFFFESPFLFITQFVLFAGVGAAIVYIGLKQVRRELRQRKDKAPRHTHDARKASKPSRPIKGRKARKAPRIPG
jgi:hypothetical protein